MWFVLLGLPFIFIGAFTRVYGWQDDRSNCFWIDHVSWGAACFLPPLAFIPYVVAYGSTILGFIFLIMGWRKIRRAKPPAPQPGGGLPVPPQPPRSSAGGDADK